MRIISGIYKNREILSPFDKKTHPMGDREKLALFNMLLPFLSDANVLDAFAGSGALGLEALSRGAKKVTFIEKSLKISKIIQKNLEALNLPPEKSEIFIKDVNKLDFKEEKFNIIIADPPYDNFKIEDIIHLVKFLNPNGVLALSSPKNLDLADLENLDFLEKFKDKTYAAARISLFKKV